MHPDSRLYRIKSDKKSDKKSDNGEESSTHAGSPENLRRLRREHNYTPPEQTPDQTTKGTSSDLIPPSDVLPPATSRASHLDRQGPIPHEHQPTRREELAQGHQPPPLERSSSDEPTPTDRTPTADRTPTERKSVSFTDVVFNEVFGVKKDKDELRRQKKDTIDKIGHLHTYYNQVLDDIKDAIEYVRDVASFDYDVQKMKASTEVKEAFIEQQTNTYESNAELINESIHAYSAERKALKSSIATLVSNISAHNERVVARGVSKLHQVPELTWEPPASLDLLPSSMEQALEEDIHNSFMVIHNIKGMNITLKGE